MNELKHLIFKTLEEKTNYEDSYGELEVKQAIELVFKEYEKAVKKNVVLTDVMRFYLVSFDGEGLGSIWFNYDGFPSHLWIKEQITNKFPNVKKPVIMQIQELSENDYNAFNCA